MEQGEPPVLSAMVAAARGAGIAGVHLSVSTLHGARFEALAGQAQVFDDDGPAPVPLTARHSYDLGSVTKIVGTTLLIAALVDRGELALDDALGRFGAPGIGASSSAAMPALPAGLDAVTLRELLTHRAGLWEWWPLYIPAVSAPTDPVTAAASLALRYPSRSGRHYSDLGFMILGRVIEVVTGMSLPAAHAALVASRLGAVDLSYAHPAAGTAAAATSVGDRIERNMVATGVPYPVTVDAEAFSGWRTHVLIGEVNDGNAFHAFGGAAGHAGLFGTVDALHVVGRAVATSLSEGDPWPALRDFTAAESDPGQLVGFRTRESDAYGCHARVIEHPGFPGVGLAALPGHRASVVLATNRLHTRAEPTPFAPVWTAAIDAAHRALHEAGAA